MCACAICRHVATRTAQSAAVCVAARHAVDSEASGGPLERVHWRGTGGGGHTQSSRRCDNERRPRMHHMQVLQQLAALAHAQLAVGEEDLTTGTTRM